tara:strand:+ start:125 stop:301 length:177 start_codon:yes stop_codon:yes gene_type:complete
MTEVERLTHIKEFLFDWLVDVLEHSDDKKGSIPMKELVQDAIDEYVRIKDELNQKRIK